MRFPQPISMSCCRTGNRPAMRPINGIMLEADHIHGTKSQFNMSKTEGGAMQTVTVAIADADPGRRRKLEQFLEDGPGIKVLGNVISNGSDLYADPEPGGHGGFAAIDDIV